VAHRRFHHLEPAGGVERDHVHAQPGHGIGIPADGIGNIVELEVQEDLATPVQDLADQRRTE